MEPNKAATLKKLDSKQKWWALYIAFLFQQRMTCYKQCNFKLLKKSLPLLYMPMSLVGEERRVAVGCRVQEEHGDGTVGGGQRAPEAPENFCY